MHSLREIDPPTRFGHVTAPAPRDRERATDGDCPLYVCAACESGWLYPAVRHTGRCPACGEGLTRL